MFGPSIQVAVNVPVSPLQPRIATPLIGLSPFELEALLEQNLDSIEDFYDADPFYQYMHPADARANYYNNPEFVKRCRALKGRIPASVYLSEPQIFVREEPGNHYSAEYNSELNRRLDTLLSQYKRTGGKDRPPPGKIFTKRFRKEREWIVEQQLHIVQYLCEKQHRYLETNALIDLQYITQHDIGDNIDYSNSTVSRLMNNLTIQLPDGKIIFAEELTPDKNFLRTNALKYLQQDPQCYENGKWKVSDRKLRDILEQKFGFDISRRTVAYYRNMIS